MRPEEASGEQERPRDPENDTPPALSPAPSTDGEQPGKAGASPEPAPPGNREQGNRGRSRRRKKRPRSGPASPPRSQPIIPAYSDTEGPRAPLTVTVSPGAPTGEAAELNAPSAAPPAVVPAPAPATAKRAAKGAVVLSVGLPGSGKTTWFKRKGVTPLSSDLLRTLLFDDPTVQRHQDLVFSSLRYLLRARLMARMPMNYVDATNLSPKERRHWVRMAREFGYEVHAVYFEVPLETCLERNRKRQRIVPEDIMQRMAAKLRPPTFEEGFTKIIVVRVKHRPLPQEAAPPSASEEGFGEPEPELDEHSAAPEADETPGESEADEPSEEPEPME
jgi:predicted kinase